MKIQSLDKWMYLQVGKKYGFLDFYWLECLVGKYKITHFSETQIQPYFMSKRQF